MSVEIPKAAIVFGSVTPPQGDVIELTVHLGCTKEVGSFECLLQNWNKKYSSGGTYPINVGMDGSIFIGRGTNVPQIITLRVESVKCESTPTENYIRVSGRCWGERIFRRVVTKTYENKKGEEIVKDLIDYYVGLSHQRGDPPVELIENTDTTYTKLEYDKAPVFDILKYIAESADKNGVIGYDFRVAPDGKFEFFPKNSKASPVSLSEKVEVSEYRKDIHRIRNRIEVYGSQDKPFPVDVDGQPWSDTLTEDLTEDAEGNLVHGVYGMWKPLTAFLDLSLDTTIKYAGAKSVKAHAPNYTYYAAVGWEFNAGKEISADEFPQMMFAIRVDDKHEQIGWLQIEDINGRTASKTFSLTKYNQWEKIILNWGSRNAEQWDVYYADFDWTKIKRINICVDQKYFSAGDIWIDQFHFGYGRWKSFAEDGASQSAYGLREFVEVDEELVSDKGCELRAKALLDYFKSPAEYLTVRSTVIDYEDTPLLAGDKIHVSLPNENVDSDFRIESVEYRVDAKTQTLEISLELGKVPPLLADYLYGSRATTVTVEKLARTKLGRFKLPTAMGEGVGMHHVGHEAGSEDGVQWPNQNAGGWDKITGWICPKYIGLYSDTADIMRFRTKNKAGTQALDHQFQPSDDAHGIFGAENAKWKEVHTLYLLLYTDGFMRIKTVGEANPKAQLSQDMLQFGPGGDAALDTWLKRVGAGQLEIRYDLLPTADQSGYIGSATKRFAKIYAVEVAISNMLFNFHVIPDADATYDLGSGLKKWKDLYLSGVIKALDAGVAVHLLPNASATYDLGSATKKWSNLYVNGVGDLGWLNVGGFTVITSARVLQNVAAAAGIITSGRFPLARLPEGTAGYVLEAQGAGFDPMYVNPNYRYEPKSHPHSQHTNIGPDDHHARDHNHAGENLSPNQVSCNTMSIAVGCNRQYTHPSSQQCVYASSVAWENCPRFYCVNYQSGDVLFQNKFRITEAEKLGFKKGLAFLNPKGKVLMMLDGEGNLHVAGKVKEGLPRKAKAGVAS
ncbi:hypothetical protein G4O51_11020 [Candidatus Bathyarchaeota archaeon A05DMB-2]|nr:hypothetical protein [Candidatus Bathyarchaeota archaeon A05DMB-2]